MAQSAVKPTSANHFEAIYEAPFAGINNSADPTDIGVSEFADATNIINSAGRLTTASMGTTRVGGANNFTLFPTTPVGDEYIIRIWLCNNFVCALDQYLNTYIYARSTVFPNTIGFYQDQVNPGFGHPYTYVTINIIGAITLIGVPPQFTLPSATTPTVFIYQPSAFYTVATTYAVGVYTGEILGYALQLNTIQPTDTPAIVNQRLNWSAPFEYTTWDASVNVQAGFDVISDSPEPLTGFTAHGNVGYIYRGNGITQLSVTGVAIQPFDLPPMTQGQAGVGCKHGLTLVQYAGTDYFVAETGVHQFGSSFTNISEKAWKGIFDSICGISVGNSLDGAQTANSYFYNNNVGSEVFDMQATALQGIIGLNNTSTTDPLPFYSLIIPTPFNTSGSDIAITNWQYDIKTAAWYKTAIASMMTFLAAHLGVPVTSVTLNGCAVGYFSNNAASYTPSSGLFSARTNTSLALKEAVLIPQITYIKTVSGNPVTVNTSLLLFNNSSAVAFGTSNTRNPVPFNITFKTETLKIGRYVTIIRVVIRAAGYGTITPAITGIQSVNEGSTATPVALTTLFNPITINSPIPATYYSSGIYTGENPTLQLNSTGFDGYVVKAMMDGTYADGDID